MNEKPSGSLIGTGAERVKDAVRYHLIRRAHHIGYWAGKVNKANAISWWRDAYNRLMRPGYGLPGSYQRVFFYHIRKAAGTTVTYSFLSLGGQSNLVYQRMSRDPEHRVVARGRVFAGWDARQVENGNYFYAWSHAPAHRLSIPEHTFTLTSLRDPAARIVSHYAMLRRHMRERPQHPCLLEEQQYMGGGFCEFLERLPRHKLLAQLHHFSPHYDVESAYESIMACNHVIFVEDFNDGLQKLAEKTGLPLRSTHVGQSSRNDKPHLTADMRDQLRTQLQPEYVLYERVRAALTSS